MVNFLKIFEKFFLHRPSGVLELRQRVRPDGAAPFSAPAERGTRTAAGVFALMGRLLFCTGKPGHTNCRRRVRPNGAAPFSAPTERGTRTAAGGFALMGRLLSLHRLNGVLELHVRP